jgi:pyruvate dehydrogenase E2 component (dihydrolipoamide acetyltransferase)
VVANNIRKVIASRLVESKRTPHAYVTSTVPLDAVLALRTSLAASGAKHSVNDFVLRASALALARVPAGAGLEAGSPVDVSFAVATPNGLMTPILRGADKMSLAAVTAAVKDLAARAKDNKLKPEEFQGGVFSVSNLGMFPVDAFAAILNPPQGAILAVGRAHEEVTLGQDGKPQSATVMSATLSVDNTRVDAADAAAWLQGFGDVLREPQQLVG